MLYIAYLDEFGHIGPYISRTDSKYHESPVFGLAGIVLPFDQVRSFGTWFYQKKNLLLAWELEQWMQKHQSAHPSTWEKKGSALYTLKNINQYREIRNFTNRFIRKIQNIGGYCVYVGVEKSKSPESHRPNELYSAVLQEIIKRLDQQCLNNSLIIVLDEHDQRQALITAASKAMYGQDMPRRSLIEPPFQVESHRYQSLQAADWISALVGRLGSFWTRPDEFPDNILFQKYFEERLRGICRGSSIRRVNS